MTSWCNSRFLWIACLLLNTFFTVAHARLNLECNIDNIYVTSSKYVLNRNLDKQTHLYFLHNISPDTLVITHPMQHVGASAGWYSYLSPSNWSVIAVTKPDFAIQCYIITAEEQSRIVDCKHVLQACQPKAKAQVNKSGDYWVVENQPWKWLNKALQKRGISINE